MDICVEAVRLHRQTMRLEVSFQGGQSFTFSAMDLYSLLSGNDQQRANNKNKLIISAFSVCPTEGLTLSFNNGLIAVVDWQQLYQFGIDSTNAGE